MAESAQCLRKTLLCYVFIRLLSHSFFLSTDDTSGLLAPLNERDDDSRF